ncbi:MAG TPA: hypothetical protein VIA81_10820 [Acidimicrobiia bacterium]|jgi:hypothetical protein
MNDLSKEDLLSVLGKALERTDPVPEWVTEASRSAYTWLTIDAELAELVFDSARDGLAGVRAEVLERQMTFRAPGVEIEVMMVGESRQLVGQVVPPQVATVILSSSDYIGEKTTDEVGRFEFDRVNPGRVRLTVRTVDGRTVSTEWVVV